MTRRITTALLGTISLLALAAPALADSGSIEEVIVTASKRPEALKDVPLAVSVLGQDALDHLNARSFEDYISSVPGMSFTEADATHPVLILRVARLGRPDAKNPAKLGHSARRKGQSSNCATNCAGVKPARSSMPSPCPTSLMGMPVASCTR